jgi:hypothetical protein
MRLSTIQSSCGREVDEIFVIEYHMNTMLRPGQIGPLFFESGNDSEKLLVIYRVVDF